MAPADPHHRTLWRRSEAVLWRQVFGDVVLLLAEGESEPLALSGGAVLWGLLGEWRDLSTLVASMAPDGKPEDPAGRELLLLLRDLEHNGIVETSV